MKRFAMICNNKVIDILDNQDIEPVWPPLPDGTPVVAVPCDETVERGMIYDTDTGDFSEYIPPEPIPTLESTPTQLDRIEKMVSKSNDELRQEGAETVILELVERGIL